ncbi:MAG: disulfide bond formation protein B [Halobacteria archaeon]|nr:disulfide bond formation protein B [Halobacteria archaeon]
MELPEDAETLAERISPVHAFAFVVAVVATSGSLWFSEGLGLIPCELCWYQRILMYPLVPILGISLWRHDDVRPYVLTLAIPGFVVATYHNYLQMTPAKGTCTSEVPCSVVQYEWHGVTIPQMSLAAFSLIIVAFLVSLVISGENS